MMAGFWAGLLFVVPALAVGIALGTHWTSKRMAASWEASSKSIFAAWQASIDRMKGETK